MINAVCFDLYGTLLDIDALAGPVAAARIPDPPAFVRDWRRKQLEYAFLSSLANAYHDFEYLTERALEHTAATRNFALTEPLRVTLLGAFGALPAYPDVKAALQTLAVHAIPAAVLTNGTPTAARGALARAGVLDLVEDVLSVDAIHAYKPDPRVYALATTHFSLPARNIAFVSSNPWDAWGAAKFGFRVAWCNRNGTVAETLAPQPEGMLLGLHELQEFVEGAN